MSFAVLPRCFHLNFLIEQSLDFQTLTHPPWYRTQHHHSFLCQDKGFYMCVRYTCVGMRRPEASLRSHPQNTLISFEIRSLIHLGFINGLEQLASKLQGLILLSVSPKHWESSIFFFTVLNKHTHFSSTDVKLI